MDLNQCRLIAYGRDIEALGRTATDQEIQQACNLLRARLAKLFKQGGAYGHYYHNTALWLRHGEQRQQGRHNSDSHLTPP